MKRGISIPAVILGGLLLASVGAELAFRVIGDRPTLDLQGMYAPFIDGMYKLRGNVDTAADWASGHLTVHTDALGLRCDDGRENAVKPGDRVDAILLGDSQGFGNGLSFADTLAGSAAGAARKNGYRVVNAAVGGHSAATQLALAEWLANDQQVKSANYVLLATPAIIGSGDHVTRANVGADGRLYDREASAAVTARVWVKTHLVSYARIRDALRNSGVGIEPTDAPVVLAMYESGTKAAQVEESFTAFVRRLNAFATAQGARLHIVYVPLTLESDFAPVRQVAEAAGRSVDRDVPLRACVTAAAQNGVPVVNLRPVLEQLRATGNLLHLPGDFHYNREVSVAGGAMIWAALSPALHREHILSSN